MKKTFAILVFFASVFVLITAQNPSDFELFSATDSSRFRLKDARGKYVALHFLLKTDCPYCIRHTQEYISKAGSLPDVVQVFIKPDGETEIEKWSTKLSGGELNITPIYRDPDAKLAEEFKIPGGYSFHGQVVHYPALILISPDGKEVFRYVGKNNTDRYSFEQLAGRIRELRQTDRAQ